MDNSHMIQKIEVRLKEMGKSKSDFYSETGISSATYSQWNTGQFGPSKRKLDAISKYTGIPIPELTGEAQKGSPPQGGEPPAHYGDLTPENRAAIDSLIEKLYKSQSAD